MRLAPGVVVGCGGAAGAAVRWGVGETLGVDGDSFPWVLLGVNTVGSFLLGVVVLASARGRRELLRLGLGVGFCGSLTTFSSFAVLSAELARDGDVATAAAFVTLSVALAAVALVAGGATARRTARSATR